MLKFFKKKFTATQEALGEDITLLVSAFGPSPSLSSGNRRGRFPPFRSSKSSKKDSHKQRCAAGRLPTIFEEDEASEDKIRQNQSNGNPILNLIVIGNDGMKL